MSIDLRPSAAGVRLTVHVQPRAARTELAGIHGDALKIRLAAPPVDGAANEALLEFIARWAQVPRAAVHLISGQTGRRKVVEINGVNAQAIQQLLPE